MSKKNQAKADAKADAKAKADADAKANSDAKAEADAKAKADADADADAKANADAEADAKAKAAQKKVSALWIRSIPESFMRCGRRFTREAYGIDLDLLTDEEIQRLKDEPNLIVEEVEALLD